MILVDLLHWGASRRREIKLYSGGGTRDGMDREKEGGFILWGYHQGEEWLEISYYLFCSIWGIRCYLLWMGLDETIVVWVVAWNLEREVVSVREYPMASRSPKRENQEIQGDLSSLWWNRSYGASIARANANTSRHSSERYINTYIQCLCKEGTSLVSPGQALKSVRSLLKPLFFSFKKV